MITYHDLRTEELAREINKPISKEYINACYEKERNRVRARRTKRLKQKYEGKGE